MRAVEAPWNLLRTGSNQKSSFFRFKSYVMNRLNQNKIYEKEMKQGPAGQRWVLGHIKQIQLIQHIKQFQHIKHIKHFKQFQSWTAGQRWVLGRCVLGWWVVGQWVVGRWVLGRWLLGRCTMPQNHPQRISNLCCFWLIALVILIWRRSSIYTMFIAPILTRIQSHNLQNHLTFSDVFMYL